MKKHLEAECGFNSKRQVVTNKAEFLMTDKHSRYAVVYICHPFHLQPELNRRKVRAICRLITSSNLEVYLPARIGMYTKNSFTPTPLAPELYLDACFEDPDNDEIMRHCESLVAVSDEVWVVSEEVSAGMRQEISLASKLGIPVRFPLDENTRFRQRVNEVVAELEADHLNNTCT